MNTAVVTPWVDHPELRADYFAALDRGPRPDLLVIVDNGSEPPILEAAIANFDNEGFSRASNQGLQYAAEQGADNVVFLNNDIAKGADGWLAKLTERIEPGVLAGSSLVYLEHSDVDGQAYPYLDGWCLGGTVEDLLALQGFDEDYDEPAYFSDCELCIRARKRGMKLVEVPTGLHHKRGVTAGYAVAAASEANRQRYEDLVRSLR